MERKRMFMIGALLLVACAGKDGATLPEGYTWDDITYVIGGYNWKARFIDSDGFIITGADENATTQYNFANPVVGNDAGWVGCHAGEVEKPYDCGPCHTTNYSAWPPDSHQDDLPGLIGTWSEPGVHCKACHGPGSLHASDPHGVLPDVDRDSELCGECHLCGGPEAVNASGGFIKHHEQAAVATLKAAARRSRPTRN